MSVLLLPPIFQFFDDNGDPLAGGTIETFAAGTTTPLKTYTDFTGAIAAPNPIQLDAAGRPESGSGAIWGQGAYKFIVKNSAGVQIGDPLDNVTSFTTLSNANAAYFETFSGNGTQTVFTTSVDLGTEEKGLEIDIFTGVLPLVTNGDFATDTDWTKGAGWTIGAGVATATDGISTAISQDAADPIVERKAYSVTYTMTRSAGGLIPSVGGVSGTERTASGTYNEIIIASSTQVLAFTGNGFTGTLDNVVINLVTSEGWAPINPNAYTINGTSLTFTAAPATGTNNIQVRAPSLLLGAASAAANLAQLYAANALASEVSAANSAASAAAIATKNKWTYSDNTSMADPSTGDIRFNDAVIADATAIAISDLSSDPTNPDLSAWIGTWDEGSSSNRGTIYIFKDTSNFALFAVNADNVDNTTWNQISITYISGDGTFTNNDDLFFGFAASGTTTVVGGITALTGDVTASGSGSVAATIANNAVTTSKIINEAVTFGKLNPAAVVTAAGGIAGNDNDTTLPTSAAVKAYVDASGSVDTASVLAATAGATVGAVGTYAFLMTGVGGGTSNYVAGDSVAGSNLRYSATGNATSNAVQSNNWVSAGGTPAGTWQAMGTATVNSGYEQCSLFLRIS